MESQENRKLALECGSASKFFLSSTTIWTKSHYKKWPSQQHKSKSRWTSTLTRKSDHFQWLRGPFFSNAHVRRFFRRLCRVLIRLIPFNYHHCEGVSFGDLLRSFGAKILQSLFIRLNLFCQPLQSEKFFLTIASLLFIYHANRQFRSVQPMPTYRRMCWQHIRALRKDLRNFPQLARQINQN